LPLPIIAIVGRPNVGKSTLFNRLAGRRVAIVSDVPGTTRDRVSVDAELLGRRFIVVDTGGLEDAPAATTAGTPAELWRHVREQAERAVDEADGVVLVVDAATGLLDADKEAADLVRRSRKPAVVAVNKSDTPARGLAAAEFYVLGAGEPVPVSAYHGTGIGDLMELLFAKLAQQAAEAEAPHVPRVAIIGRPNVGKSALFNALLGVERAIVSPMAGTTRDSIDTTVTFPEGELTFIDTAGLRRRGKVEDPLEKYSALRTLHAIERCHIAVIVLDVQEFVSEQDAHVGGYVQEASRGVVVVVNKWDLASRLGTGQEQAVEEVRRGFNFLAEPPVLFTSALTGRGVGTLAGAVFDVYREFSMEIPQDALSKALADAVAKRQPPTRGTRRVKLGAITQSGVRPPTLRIRTNEPELIHFSYRRYLLNSFRKSFGLTGSPVKLEFTTGEV
jgi:GTP-binding protein